MKPIKDEFSVVIVGWWNPRIFSVPWIKKNLCSNTDGKTEIELALPINNPEAMPRLSFEDIYLFTGSSKIEIKPAVLNQGTINKCAETAKKILSLLTHTPVSAIGINCGFAETENHHEVISMFTISDTARIDSEKYRLEKTEIRRLFKSDDNFTLNLIIKFDPESLNLHFNYHSDVSESSSALEKIPDNIFDNIVNNSKTFIKDVYNLECEGNFGEE